MSKVVTKEDINQRLLGLGKDAKIIGDYQKQQSKTLFECSKGHTWITSADNVLRKSGCPTCSDNRITKDEFIKRLTDRKITLLGDYIDYNTYTEFQCNNGHKWLSKPVFLAGKTCGNGCVICQRANRRLNEEIVAQRLLSQGNGIYMIGDYLGSVTKTLFKCRNGHTWYASPDSVTSGRGCSQCAKTGFSPNKPASAYILIFDEFIKFGITNNLKNRLKAHKSNGLFTVHAVKHYDLGESARQWETNVKKKYGGKFAKKDQCPDGYTETLPINLLEEVTNLLNN